MDNITSGVFFESRCIFDQCVFFFLRCRVVVDNVGDHVMPEQSVFCHPDELDWAYVILQTCTQTVQILLSLSSPSTFPVTTSASMPCLLMTCPKKSSCLCLIVLINVRWTPAALRTSRLLFFSVHEIFSILLKNHISTALSLSFIVSEIVQVSHPYDKTDHT